MPFKDFDDLLSPEPRFANCSAGDPTDWFRPMAFKDHYGMAAEISLTRATPDHVHEMFDRARHTFVFAWFDYELTVVADQYALATLEGALRSYFGTAETLRPLLKRAVKEGVIPKFLHGGHGAAKYLPVLRNHWAHGNNGFGTPVMSATTLGMCAEVIRSLYPEVLWATGQPLPQVPTTPCELRLTNVRLITASARRGRVSSSRDRSRCGPRGALPDDLPALCEGGPVAILASHAFTVPRRA